MKAKQKKDLQERTVPELKQLVQEAKDELFRLQLEKAQYKIKNMRAVFNKRKELAYLLTKMREKELVA